MLNFLKTSPRRSFVIFVLIVLGGVFFWKFRGVHRQSAPGEILKAEISEKAGHQKQVRVPTLSRFKVDGDIEEWVGIAPQLELASEKSTIANIVLAKTPQGLAIAVHFKIPADDLAKKQSDFQKAPFLEIELQVTEPKLGPVGFGNQFGYTQAHCKSDLTSKPTESSESGFSLETQKNDPSWDGAYDDNAPDLCRWVDSQKKYRRRLNDLFLRRWQVGLEEAVEKQASVSWKELGGDPALREMLAPLEPQGLLIVRQASATGLEILIPWEAFPPTDELDLEKFSIQLALVNSNAKLKSDSIQATFEVPRQYFLTPCHLKLEALNPYQKPIRAYFRPTQNLEVNSHFSFHQSVQGYKVLPDESDFSPMLTVTPFQTRRLSTDEVVCGPRLGYANAGIVHHPNCMVDGQEAEFPCRDLQSDFSAKKLSSGIVLVKNGPWVTTVSPFGSGQCGSCSLLGLQMVAIDQNGGFHTALDYQVQMSGIDGDARGYVADADFLVSEDWQRFTIRKQVENQIQSEWFQTSYCWHEEKLTYDICEKTHRVVPPKQRHFIWGENSEQGRFLPNKQ